MKILFLFFLNLLVQYTNSQTSFASGNIVINIENINTSKGYIRLALYDSSDNFLDEKKGAFYSFKIDQKGTKKITLENIKYGDYAIAVYHDENSNEKLESNAVGIPVEPYCFSGNGHSKWRPPVYEDAKFSVSKPETKITLRLEKWKFF